NFRHKNLAAVHLLDTTDDESHPLIQSDPEPSHSRLGDRDSSSRALLHKDWNHAAAASCNIAITHATEMRVLFAGVGICLHEHLFCAEFSRTIKIHRIHGFVCAEGKNSSNVAIDRGINHVLAPNDV